MRHQVPRILHRGPPTNIRVGACVHRMHTHASHRSGPRTNVVWHDGRPMPRYEPVPPDVLLERVPPPMREIAERLRGVVRTAMPQATERVRTGWNLIGYDLPVGRRSVYFAFVLPEVEHVHLGFAHGSAMRDPERRLQGAGITKQVRWLTFVPGDPIDVDVCASLLDEAAIAASLGRAERMRSAMDGPPGLSAETAAELGIELVRET